MAKAEIKKICVKDHNKQRPIDASFFTYDASEILNDSEIDVVVELIDDAKAAFDIVKKAVENGKHVVTANKKMLAENFKELYELQQKNNVALLYEGSVFSDEIQTKIIKEALERAKISDPDDQLSWPLIVKSGTNDYKKGVHFYYNYSSEEKELEYSHGSGKELISEQPVAKGETLKIDPWDVLIIEEK